MSREGILHETSDNFDTYRVFFFTGSAQKVLSMELVPPNSKKTTKYTGSAQYTKNG